MRNEFCWLSLLVAAGSAVAAVRQVSIADRTDLQSIIAEGTASVYQGHPTAIRTGEGILTVWCSPHGGFAGPAALSADQGQTWMRVDGRFPTNYSYYANCPSVYRLKDAEGKERLWVWCQVRKPYGAPVTMPNHESNWVDYSQFMPSVMSKDDGKTWKEMPPLGEKFACVMAFSSVVALPQPGVYLGFFHKGLNDRDTHPLKVYQTKTEDGGFTWSDPVCVGEANGKSLCEPYCFRSPDGRELCCLMRENVSFVPAYMMFSSNEGATWTTPEPAPAALAGHRHSGTYLNDGRLFIAFRGNFNGKSTANLRAWVGRYDQIKSGDTKGVTVIDLLPNYNGVDTGYPGVLKFEDGSLTVVTYGWYHQDTTAHQASVIAVRVTKDILDDLAGEPAVAELHISPTGDDAANGTPEHPLRMLKEAYGRIPADGVARLVLADGEYAADCELLATAATSRNFFIESASGDPTRVVIRAANNFTGRFFSVDGFDFRMSGVTLTGFRQRIGLLKNGSVENCIVTGNDLSSNASDARKGNLFFLTRNGSFVNCLFYGNVAPLGSVVCQADGNTSGAPQVVNCTFVGSKSVSMEWENGTVANCVEWQVTSVASQSDRFFNCAGDFVRANAPNWLTLTADPFVGSVNNNYSIAKESALAFAGNAALYPTGSSATDLVGNPRIGRKNRISIGAYEVLLPKMGLMLMFQ